MIPERSPLFFVVSKIYWLIASPIALLLFAALAGALLARSRFGRPAQAVAVTALGLLLIGALTPVGLATVSPLENRFPQAPADMAAPYGIIILGGAINGVASTARGQPTFGEGERVIEAVLLAKRYPEARILFTGGSGSLFYEGSTEAEEAKKLMVELGVDPARITLEKESRNTEENASFSATQMRPRPDQRWLLVTSAIHTPRSMGLFERAGFNVTAYPVAFRTTGPGLDHLRWEAFPSRNLGLIEGALREWMGLVVYRATGRIDHLFPGPGDVRP